MQESPNVDIVITQDQIRLSFEKGWLKEHPLFKEDLHAEQKFLGQAGIDLKW